MNLQEWQDITVTSEQRARMFKTKPGALALVVAQLLYDFCDENRTSEHRGMVLYLNNAERKYVSGLDDKSDWPKIDGREGSYIHVKKALREIQDLLEAYALREASR